MDSSHLRRDAEKAIGAVKGKESLDTLARRLSMLSGGNPNVSVRDNTGHSKVYCGGVATTMTPHRATLESAG